MWPRLSSKLITRWLLVTLVASLVAHLDRNFAAWCALIPSRVVHGELWRLFTWVFVEPSALGLIFTLAAIYKFGGELEVVWGERRLERFVTQIVIAAALATTAVTVLGGRLYAHFAGMVIPDLLVIAWARQFPSRTLVLYGMLTLSGDRLVAVVVGASVLFAFFGGLIAMAPELAVTAFAAAYPRAWLRR